MQDANDQYFLFENLVEDPVAFNVQSPVAWEHVAVINPKLWVDVEPFNAPFK